MNIYSKVLFMLFCLASVLSLMVTKNELGTLLVVASVGSLFVARLILVNKSRS
jgi:hypothetical protein